MAERDKSLHIKRDGRIFQMLDGYSGKPIPYADAKHNYTKKDYDRLKVGQGITFKPMFGNRNPICSTLKRIQ